MKSQAIYCPNCDRKVPVANINLGDMVGMCSGCDHMFSVRDMLDSGAIEEREPSRPSGVTIEKDVAGQLLIKRTWFQPMFIFLAFFCIAWDGFLVFWYSMAIFEGGGGDGFELIALFFPIAHVAVGIGLTYYTIAGFFNRSEIFLDQDGLHIRHRPLPWRGNRDLRHEEIQEIELEYSVSQDNQNGMMQMVVSAHHTDGRQIVLLNHIPVRHAEYIAWHLSNALDVPLVRKDRGEGISQAQAPQWMRRIFGGG